MADQDTVVLTLQIRYTRKLWEGWEEECRANSNGTVTALDRAENDVAVALIRDDEPLQVRGSVVPFEQAPALPSTSRDLCWGCAEPEGTCVCDRA